MRSASVPRLSNRSVNLVGNIYAIKIDDIDFSKVVKSIPTYITSEGQQWSPYDKKHIDSEDLKKVENSKHIMYRTGNVNLPTFYDTDVFFTIDKMNILTYFDNLFDNKILDLPDKYLQYIKLYDNTVITSSIYKNTSLRLNDVISDRNHTQIERRKKMLLGIIPNSIKSYDSEYDSNSMNLHEFKIKCQTINSPINSEEKSKIIYEIIKKVYPYAIDSPNM